MGKLSENYNNNSPQNSNLNFYQNENQVNSIENGNKLSLPVIVQNVVENNENKRALEELNYAIAICF